MGRLPVIAGNWKMHLSRRRACALARAVAAHEAGIRGRRCILFPAFIHLEHVRQRLRGSGVRLGAQNCWHVPEGAYTGEIGPTMLRDCGVGTVLLGHSERRHVLGESDELIAAKLGAALDAGLEVVLCVGETLDEREGGATYEVLERQLQALTAVPAAALRSSLMLAYEPVWAIGTGRTASPETAQEAHAELRRRAAGILGPEAAASLPILYGGSVKPGNAASLLAQPDVDGALVGGASLNPDAFGAILDAAPALQAS